MEKFDRVVRILKKPLSELMNVKFEEINTDYLLRFMAIISLVPVVGYFIGMGIVGLNIQKPGILITPIEWAAVGGIIQYILSFAAFYITSVDINLLAKNFSSKKNNVQSIKLAAYSSTLGLLGGIPLIIPQMQEVRLLFGLYGIYILYSGLPILMETPKNKVIFYEIRFIILFLYFVMIENIMDTLISWNHIQNPI